MLREKLLETTSILLKYADIEKKKQTALRVRTIHTPLTNKRNDIKNAINSYKILNTLIPETTSRFINSQILMKFRSNVNEKIIPNKQDIDVFLTSIDNWNDNLKKDWTTFLKGATHDVLETLKVLLPLVEENKTIIQIMQNINQLINIWPLDDNCVKKLNEYIEEGQKIVEDLGASPDVQVFIKKVLSGKATVFDLNQGVLDWVKAKRLDAKLKVSF